MMKRPYYFQSQAKEAKNTSNAVDDVLQRIQRTVLPDDIMDMYSRDSYASSSELEDDRPRRKPTNKKLTLKYVSQDHISSNLC